MINHTAASMPKSFSAAAPAQLLSKVAGSVLCLGILTSGLAGCDKGTSPTEAVRNASNNALVEATKATNSEELADSLRKPASEAKAAAAQGSKGDQAAASILDASSSGAVGENFAQRASLADQDVRRHVMRLSSLLNDWSRQNALAEASQSFDPSSQIRELQSKIDEASSTISTRRSTAADYKARLDGLDKQVQAKRSQADGLASQAGQLSQQATALSAREGVSLVEQANVLRRQGDALRNEAELLDLQAQELRSQVREADALVQEAQNQSRRFADSQQALRDRQAASRQNASQALEQAEKVRTELSSVLTQLNTARDTFQSQYDEASKGFKSAASASGRSSQAAPQSAKVSGGNAQLALAGLQLMKMQQLDSLAGGYAMLVSAQPALPDRTALQGTLDELVTQAKATREEAKETLEAAKTQFNGISGPTRERFEEITARFESLTKAPAVSMGASSPQALMQAAVAASKEGRWDDLRGMYAPAKTDDGKALVEMGIVQSEQGKKLNDAVQDKFGKGLSEFLAAHEETKQLGEMMAAMSSGDLTKLDISSIKVREAGDKAMITMPGVPMPLQAVKAGGMWKFDGTQMDAIAPMLIGMKPMIDKLVAANVSFTTKVQNGEFADENAAAAEYAKLMQEALPAMPGMGGGDVEPGAE